ncbi:ecto-ADP-ribosyltransferase 4-like [Labrus bergylta]|uniref:ecto-ADP-ribosyltransferase 4-like n=1 Tax=Labrus bergylta TaxID=56723 RepID=UPI003313653A
MLLLRALTCTKLKSPTHLAAFCVLVSVALLLYHHPFLLLRWCQKPGEETKTAILPLDMATESIDDMFDGCRSEAASMIDLFGVFEWRFNRNFSYAWAVAERNAKKPAHRQLKDDHAVALHMYTQVKFIQQEFNKAVQTGKHEYNTYGFRFHYLYFYLTDAVKVLRQNSTSCRTTYHRTKTHFNHNVINTNMRFGAFTWASLSKQTFPFNGNVSCFEINSCFGADITYYSASEQMGQVLIPPYEVFQITNVRTDDPWCTVVYKLQSTKTQRNDLNCKLSDREMKKYFGKGFTNSNTSSHFWMITSCVILLAIISAVLIKQRQKSFVASLFGALLVWAILLVTLRVSLLLKSSRS